MRWFQIMLSSKLCSKKNIQLCIKVLVLASIIGLYFVLLLRESFAAWESTKTKNAHIVNVSKNTAVNSGRKFISIFVQIRNWIVLYSVAFIVQTPWPKIPNHYYAIGKSNSTVYNIESSLRIFRRNQYRCRTWFRSSESSSRRKLPKISFQRTISAECVGVLYLAGPRNSLVQYFQSGQQYMDVLFQYFGRLWYKIFAAHEYIAARVGPTTFSTAHTSRASGSSIDISVVSYC